VVEDAATLLPIKIIPGVAAEIADIESAVSVFAKNRIKALLASHQSVFILGGRKHLLAFGAKYWIRVIGPRREFTEDGGLMSHGSIFDDHTRRGAQLADKIPKGVKPADCPIEQPTTFELVVNKNIAKTLSITFPSEILLQATKIIE
jgi:putative ABC transport system substrate-binding protein